VITARLHLIIRSKPKRAHAKRHGGDISAKVKEEKALF
jgi:hypothetical protein